MNDAYVFTIKTYLVRVKPFEQVHSSLKVINHFLLWNVTRVAARRKSTNASTMFGPFVLPEGLIVAGIILPIRVHGIKDISPARRGYDGGYVGVLTRWVAEGIISAIAVVRPVLC